MSKKVFYCVTLSVLCLVIAVFVMVMHDRGKSVEHGGGMYKHDIVNSQSILNNDTSSEDNIVVLGVEPDECIHLYEDEDILISKHRRKLIKHMWESYQSGDSPLTIANTFAMADFKTAKSFYHFATASAELLEYQVYLEKTHHGRKLLRTIMDETTAISNGSLSFYNVESALESFWESEIPLLKKDVKSYPYMLEYTISDIESYTGPFNWLTSQELSPFGNLIEDSLTFQRWDVVNGIFNNFPELINSSNVFDAKIKELTLLSLGFSVTSKSKSSPAFVQLLGLITSGEPLVLELNDDTGASEVNSSLAALKRLDITFPVIDYREYDFPVSDDSFVFDNLLADEKSIKERCDALHDWFESKDYNYLEIEAGNNDLILASILDSPELKYCEASKINAIVEDFKMDSIHVVSKYRYALTKAKKLDDIPIHSIMGELDTPASRTLVLLGLSSKLSGLSNIDDEDILNWSIQKGYKPDPEFMHFVITVMDDKSWISWAKELDWTQNAVKNATLSASQSGRINIYKYLTDNHQNQSWSEDEVDPLFFLIKNYQKYSYLMKDLEVSSVKLLKEVELLGIPVRPHHKRALYQMQQLKPELYQRLITAYPRLTLTEVPEYFSVTCDM